MGLKLIKGADGRYRRWWYATVCRQGKHVSESTGIPVRGRIPLADGVFSLSLTGDSAFEKSKADALARLQAIRETSKEDADIIARKAFRKRTGLKLVDTKLTDLPLKWRGLAREHQPSERRLRVYDGYFKQFADFAKAHATDFGGRCDSVNAITPELATAFFNKIRGEYAWESSKSIMSLLSGAWRRFATNGQPNPFGAIIKSKRGGENRVHKKPLTELEIDRVLDEARKEEGRYSYPLYALALTAASTGMRLSDVCHLQWADVDLHGGFIDTTTAKTGERVTIPLFNRLRMELETRATSTTEKGVYVFPSAAAEYDRNRAGITRSIKPVIARVLFPTDRPVDVLPIEDEQPHKTPMEILAAIDDSKWQDAKKVRIRDTYERFAMGKSYATITAETGRPKGLVSGDLAEVEILTGETIRKGDPRQAPGHTSQRALCNLTRQERKVGKFAASLYGWHSFRTSFVTLAIENGVPVEDVQKVVGHRTMQMTRDYFRPEKKHAAERVRRQMSKHADMVLNAIPKGETLDTLPVLPVQNATESAQTAFPALPTQGTGKDLAERLARLDGLLSSGVITQAERDTQRARILAEI